MISFNKEDIDQQHGVLLGCLTAFFKANEEGADSEELLRLLDQVRNYTSFHFCEEEAVMKDNSYPGLALHRIIHGNLIESLLRFRSKISDGEDITSESKFFLTHWFEIHDDYVDQDFLNFLEKKTSGL